MARIPESEIERLKLQVSVVVTSHRPNPTTIMHEHAFFNLIDRIEWNPDHLAM